MGDLRNEPVCHTLCTTADAAKERDECERYVSSLWYLKTLDGVIGPGCFVPGQDGFNGDEYKKSSEQWRHDLKMKPL